MIRELFLKILHEYPRAKTEKFANHPLAHFIRHDLPDFLKSRFSHYPDLIWKASAGKGAWADAPWMAILDPLVTSSAQHGYFPIFLFERDFNYMYLSFNQGMTELRDEFSDAQAKEILKSRAKILRERVTPHFKERFSQSELELNANNPHARLALYEPGHAFGTKYMSADFPSNEKLISDIESMIELYRLITLRGGTAEFDFSKSFEGDYSVEEEKLDLDEKRRLRYHRTIERNPRLSKKAKEIHGFTCQVCGFNYEDIYGKLGHGFVEVHYKLPFSKLSIDQTLHLSPAEDFAVVCSNCHRMIHRKGAPDKFDDFKQFYKNHHDLFNYKYKQTKSSVIDE